MQKKQGKRHEFLMLSWIILFSFISILGQAEFLFASPQENSVVESEAKNDSQSSTTPENKPLTASKPDTTLSIFLIIGIFINIIMLLVFIFWAVAEWRKTSQ
ncbi:MAG: hypothetical protein DRR16_13795 [Candidatus Parabeggiatoa sp. nov. 3]|nr:MAG: hypothetical protein DRQ99_08915 [Gammaproteobacteria bacterium]RKZ84763.1 MAG: hypothetical protein DRR16_13795 [Gammaproteobacteria bacterium]